MFFTASARQTQKVGRILAEETIKTVPGKRTLVFGLLGDLGSGKTTFLQGFAKGLGIKENILSPTFVIIRRHGNFYHIDCYRLQKPEELLALGFKKIISDPENIVAVEWADRIKKIMPKNTVWLGFEFIDKRTRKIVVK